MVVDICRSQYEKYDKIIFPNRPMFGSRPDSYSMMANAAKYLYERYNRLRHFDEYLANKTVMTMEEFLFSDKTAFVWDIDQIVSPNKVIKWWTDATQEQKTRYQEYLWSYGIVIGYRYGNQLILDTDVGKIYIDSWKCTVADVPPAVVAMLRRQMGKSCPLKEAQCQA